MYHKIWTNSIFAALLAVALVLASSLQFAKAQETPEESEEEVARIQALIDELMEVHPMLAELQADDDAFHASEGEGTNPAQEKLAAMDSTEALHLLLGLQALDALQDLSAAHMLDADNQTAS